MANLSDLIDKDHDFCLKNFSGVGKVSDIAESVNAHHFLTGNDNVDKLRILDDFGDDFSTGLTETNCKESSDFDNKVLKCIRLSLLTLIIKQILLNSLNTKIFLLNFSDSLKRIERNLAHSLEHIFERFKCNRFQVPGKEQRRHNKYHAHKERSSNVEFGRELLSLSGFEYHSASDVC
jgi:hypothetical protein